MMSGSDNAHAGLVDLGRARSDVYAFLASAFLAPPSDESLLALGDTQFLGGVAVLFGAESFKALRQYAGAAERTAELQRQAGAGLPVLSV